MRERGRGREERGGTLALLVNFASAGRQQQQQLLLLRREPSASLALSNAEHAEEEAGGSLKENHQIDESSGAQAIIGYMYCTTIESSHSSRRQLFA